MGNSKSDYIYKLRCRVVGSLLMTVGLNRLGNELVAIFGTGSELDNQEVLLEWMYERAGDLLEPPEKVWEAFVKKLHDSIVLMVGPPIERFDAGEALPYIEASTIERDNLASSIVFLVGCFLLCIERDGKYYGANAWEPELAKRHCREKVISLNLHYQITAATELPRLANHYFRRSVKPWVRRTVLAQKSR